MMMPERARLGCERLDKKSGGAEFDRSDGTRRGVMRGGVVSFVEGSACVALGTLTIFLAASIAHAEGPRVAAVPGPPALLLSGFDLAPLGYATDEFFISGTAVSYKLAGAPTSDGHWDAVPAEIASYATRIVVVRPTDPKKFNGSVVVEWLNVSAGTDASPDWNAAHREIMRSGYAYVGVSAQKVGVEGGPSVVGLGTPLKKANPERYGGLSHPGDRFAYDIFSQAGRILQTSDASKVLGSLVPKRVIAVGESQSAIFLTTYVNAVDPLAKVYDGFLIHSRFGGAASLENAAMTGTPSQRGVVKLRADLRAPVITVITETDLLVGGNSGFHRARQPDNERLRVWELPGTAHADNYTFTVGFMDSGSTSLEKLAAAYEPTAKILGGDLSKPANNAPQHHYVVEAALWNLDRWIRTGQAPPNAVPIKVTEGGQPGAPASLVLDANGLAEGGVRTPWVDVPIARLSGVGNAGGPAGFMVGVCEPFDAATLDRLYPGGKREYLKKFEASLASAIEAGFILPADRQEILDLAAIAYRGSH
jgi:alpha/beta hydrolase family protein